MERASPKRKDLEVGSAAADTLPPQRNHVAKEGVRARPRARRCKRPGSEHKHVVRENPRGAAGP
eukprot:8759927-Alexandrium_andersonii.AAC.1